LVMYGMAVARMVWSSVMRKYAVVTDIRSKASLNPSVYGSRGAVACVAESAELVSTAMLLVPAFFSSPFCRILLLDVPEEPCSADILLQAIGVVGRRRQFCLKEGL